MMGQWLAGLEGPLARTGDGCFVIDADGRIAFWNRAAEKILGWPSTAVVGRRCCDVFVGMDGDGNRLCYEGCHVRNLVALEEPVQSFDMRTRTKAGRGVWINVSILPLAADGQRDGGRGGRRGMIHLFRDVTATKELLTLVHERLAGPSAAAAPGGAAASLSRRELDVLRLIVQGRSTAAIAEQLHVSRATVRNHVQNIFGKLGVHSRLEAVAFVTKQRLL
jgi:PAS domain S-box-containing protein